MSALTRYEVDVLMSDVEEAGRAEGDDGRADVWIGDDVDAEDVGDRPSVLSRQLRRICKEAYALQICSE